MRAYRNQASFIEEKLHYSNGGQHRVNPGRQGEERNWRACFGFFVGLCLALIAGAWPAAAAGSASPPTWMNVQQLVRDVMWNEVQARKHPVHPYEYVLTEQVPGGLKKTLQIQTPQGSAARLLSINGKPPSPKECAQNLNLLGRLASDQSLQQARLKSQRTDEARRAEMFSAMPKAFFFRFAGIDKKTGWVVLDFWPNPEFRPRTREDGMLQGLEGTVWVDPASQRLVRIDGKLAKDTTFGWGFLARLSQGGGFLLEQSKINDGSWHVSRLDVDLQGTMLLVRKLNVKMKNSYSSFKVLPKGLTLVQAVNVLKSVQTSCAQ